jgi:hypothetical protein
MRRSKRHGWRLRLRNVASTATVWIRAFPGFKIETWGTHGFCLGLRNHGVAALVGVSAGAHASSVTKLRVAL